MSDTSVPTDFGPDGLIRITTGNSLPGRLLTAGFGVALMFGASEAPLAWAWLPILAGLVPVASAILTADSAWSLRPGRLTIDEVAPLGRWTRDLLPGAVRRVEAIEDRGGEGPSTHYVRLWLTDGGRVSSPVLRNKAEAASLARLVSTALDVNSRS